MRLLGIEIRRAFARRLTKIVFIIAILGIVAAGLSVFFKSQRSTGFSGPPAAQQQDMRNEQIQVCMRGGPLPGGEGFAPGEGGVVQPVPQISLPPVGTQERQNLCEKAAEQLQFGETIDRRFHLDQVKDIYKGLSVWFAIIAWLLAASYIGAEWRAGTMTTLLTWEPRRIRVMLTKALAAAIVTFGIVITLQALLFGALYPAAAFHGTTAGTDASFWRSFSFLGLRIGGLATVATLLGFAAGSIGRNTAAGLGAGFVYLAVIEGGLLGGLIPAVRPWLIVGNSIVFISNERQVDIHGRSPTQAGLLLLGYALGIFLIATGFFRKRDVT